MNDRPSAEELLRAVERFLDERVIPNLTGVGRFHARVAANVVAMVAREIETEDGHLHEEWKSLAQLLESDEPRPGTRHALKEALGRGNEELVARIRAGDADGGERRAAVLAHLRRVVAAKMEVSKPPRQRSPGPPGS